MFEEWHTILHLMDALRSARDEIHSAQNGDEIDIASSSTVLFGRHIKFTIEAQLTDVSDPAHSVTVKTVDDKRSDTDGIGFGTI